MKYEEKWQSPNPKTQKGIQFIVICENMCFSTTAFAISTHTTCSLETGKSVFWYLS